MDRREKDERLTGGNRPAAIEKSSESHLAVSRPTHAKQEVQRESTGTTACSTLHPRPPRRDHHHGGGVAVSWEAVLWATTDAPIANVNEFAVLVMLSEKADPDGCSSFPSRPTMANRTKIDPKTVLRTLQALEKRKLIAKGNQAAAAYLRRDRRPVVYDLLIPYDWFPNIERINKERAEKGKPPLTSQSRPAIASAPDKTRRSDLGKKRPKKDRRERGDCESPREEADESAHGGTDSPARGDCESGTGGLRDTRTSPYEPVPDPVLPSAADDSSEQRDGGMDGSGAVGEKEEKRPSITSRAPVTPGVELLMAIGADQPEFLLTGKTLQDQGLLVTGMLDEGWTAQQLRQVIASRPLPQPIRTSVGALVARRLRDALAAPAPSSVPRLPGPTPPGFPASSGDAPTPTAPSWEERQQVWHLDSRPGECNGDDGLCGRPAAPGYDQCVSCMGWGFCGECHTRRAPEGKACDECTAEQAYARA